MYRLYLRQHLKGLVIWIAVLILLGVTSLQKLVGLQIDPNATNELMDAFPNALKVAYGIGSLDITTLDGYYSVLSLYITLAIASYAGILGAKIIYSEEDLKTSEFLFTKPVSRLKVLSHKLLGAITIITLLTVISSYISYVYTLMTFDDSITNYWQLVFSQYVVSLLFMCIGTLFSCTKYSNRAMLITVSAIFLGFVLRMSGLMYEINLAFATPFYAFEASDIVLESINLVYVAYYIIISIIMLVVGNHFLKNRDINN